MVSAIGNDGPLYGYVNRLNFKTIKMELLNKDFFQRTLAVNYNAVSVRLSAGLKMCRQTD